MKDKKDTLEVWRWARWPAERLLALPGPFHVNWARLPIQFGFFLNKKVTRAHFTTQVFKFVLSCNIL